LVSRKISNIVLIIGIGLLVAGPILGVLTDKVTLCSGNPKTIDELSSSEIQEAFNCNFRLKRNQKIIIKISVYFENITVQLKIIDRLTYDQEYEANSDPTVLPGESFVHSTFTWGESPGSSTSGASSVTLTEQEEDYIEFAGDISGDNLISLPGSYTVIVYGDNSGSGTDVYFNIAVKIDGPGDFLGSLFVTIGIIVIVCYAILVSYKYLNKLRRGE